MLLNRQKLYRDFLVCCDTHTLYNQFSNSLTEKFYFSLFKRIVISKIKKHNIPVFYTASENREILTNQYGINTKNVYPYLIGTDSNVFYPDPESGEQLRRELGISRDKKVILYAGKFNYPKSPHLLVDALKLVENTIPESVLVMVGGKNEEYFNEHFKEDSPFKNIQLKVLDAVNVSQLNRYYNMADIVVFPKENTLSALDCQLTETPVVMEEDMTNSERLQKGGLTYKPGNLDDLGKKIKILLNDDSLRKTLGAEGRQFISDNYSYKNIVRDVEGVIIERLK
jgi:glycosyltransferase involved in cell wall biosynthesis